MISGACLTWGRPSFFVIVLIGAAACSKDDRSPIAEMTPKAAEPVVWEPIDLRSLELDGRPADDAEAGAWVRCVGGVLREGERHERVCRDESLAWVDPARDRIAVVVTAANALLVEILGEAARFVQLRARVDVDLRTLMADLEVSRIAEETRLSLEVRIEGEGDGAYHGTIELSTPRVLQLLYGISERGLRFGDEAEQAGSAPPVVIVLTRDGRGVRYAPPGAVLKEVDVIAVDRGRSVVLPACSEGAPSRRVGVPALEIYDRRTGRLLAKKDWPTPEVACDEHGVAIEEPSGEALADEVRAALKR